MGSQRWLLVEYCYKSLIFSQQILIDFQMQLKRIYIAQDHMLTFKHVFNSKNLTGYFGLYHGKPFLLPLISNKLLSGCVMVRELGINELFLYLSKFSSKCKCVYVCRECSPREEKRMLSKNAHTSIYIYIHYTLYLDDLT